MFISFIKLVSKETKDQPWLPQYPHNQKLSLSVD